MHQAKKGNNWHFGMKAHIGIDAESGLVHSVQTTLTNEHDITQAHKLVHGKEQAVLGNAGYTGVEKRVENPVALLCTQIEALSTVLTHLKLS